MIDEHGNVVIKIYLTGVLVFLVTAWFSAGYNQFDEHFQILEFAGLKLGLTQASNLPWEYSCMMRPALQPMVAYTIFKTSSFFGITSPFLVAFFIRLLSAFITLVSIHLVIRCFSPEIANRKMVKAFILLSFLLWFIPYNGVRFASETIAGRVFLIGLAFFLLQKKLRAIDYLITGFLLGISFVTRYQEAFMVIGFAAWLIIIKKTGLRNFSIFSAGTILATLLGVLIDRWYYGQWVLTSWNYFMQNILLGKASGFGVSPWWYYMEQTFMNAIPPFSLIFILAVFLYFIVYPKNLITWTLAPFLALHFLIPHKEIRFLFPIIGFLPVMIAEVGDFYLKKKGPGFLEKRFIKISAKLFWCVNLLMVVILCFRPADAQISLFKTLWDDYPGSAKLYFTGFNPYHRANADICFYKRKSLTFQHVDYIQKVIPSKDTINLIITNEPISRFSNQFQPILVYATIPGWLTKFNFNHWMDRTFFWYVYELKNTRTKD